jgi:hypothetical protein
MRTKRHVGSMLLFFERRRAAHMTACTEDLENVDEHRDMSRYDDDFREVDGDTCLVQCQFSREERNISDTIRRGSVFDMQRGM